LQHLAILRYINILNNNNNNMGHSTYYNNYKVNKIFAWFLFSKQEKNVRALGFSILTTSSLTTFANPNLRTQF